MRSAPCFRAAIALSASMVLFGAGPGGAADQAAGASGAKPGYFRFSAIHGDTLVFTAEGTREVENPPHASFLGKDLQLEAALDHLTRKLQESPLPVPQPQAIPPVGESARPSKPGERP